MSEYISTVKSFENNCSVQNVSREWLCSKGSFLSLLMRNSTQLSTSIFPVELKYCIKTFQRKLSSIFKTFLRYLRFKLMFVNCICTSLTSSVRNDKYWSFLIISVTKSLVKAPHLCSNYFSEAELLNCQ